MLSEVHSRSFKTKEKAVAESKLWYVKQSPEIGPKFVEFYDACKEKGVLDQKTKKLLMVALACVNRCSHCTNQNIEAAFEAGASKEEVAEALLIAAVEGAGTQLYWAKEVYDKHLGGG
jgi:AhpD family alkylhydroperoxidase